MDLYDKILDLFEEKGSDGEYDLIAILRLLIRISRKRFKSISENEYLNYLILILNISMVNVPDYCHNKGKSIKLLNLPQHKNFIKKLREEFSI